MVYVSAQGDDHSGTSQGSHQAGLQAARDPFRSEAVSLDQGRENNFSKI
jgi:hypothetical protein